jgi:RimJ/RimL family protein N-acetyltransferase
MKLNKKHILTTERLKIRRFTENDYIDLYEYLSDKRTYKYEPGKPITIKHSKKLCIERSKNQIFLAVELKAENKVVGHIYFNKIDPKNLLTYEVGYIFNKKYQGKGFATEAIQKYILYQFSRKNIHKIIAHCSPKNVKSWKLLERLKFKREGNLRKNIFFNKDKNNKPIWLDTYEYGLLKEDIK